MCFHQPTTLPTDIFGKFGNMFLGFEWALKYSLLLTLQVTCLSLWGSKQIERLSSLIGTFEEKRDNYYNRPSKYPSRIVCYPMSCGPLSFVDGYEGQVQDFRAFRARARPKDERSGEFRYRGLLWLLFQGKEGTPRNLGKLAPSGSLTKTWNGSCDLNPLKSAPVGITLKILEDFLSQEPRRCGWSYLGFHKAMKFSRSLRCSGWECSLGRSGSWWSCQPKSESVPCSIFIAERVVMGVGCCIRVLFNFPSPDFEIGGGTHSVLELLFFLGRLVQPVDFHWIFNYLSFSFPLASFLPLLWASPPQTSKITTLGGAAAAPCLKPQDNHRILRKAKLCTLLNWAPPRLKPVVLSKADCWGRFGGGEERTSLKSRRDSPHSRSDGLLQAQLWWLGQLQEILPPPPPPP